MDRPSKQIFNLILIKPTHYDDDGYPMQWFRSAIPSNSLASLYGLALDCTERNVLGDQVDLVITAIDECNTQVRPQRLIHEIKTNGGIGLIAMVGVQSNQFPRAIDLSRPFLEADLPVCIGGFHVSGCLSMLDDMPADLIEAQNMGISFFAGEAEADRLSGLLIDAYEGRLKPVYDYLDDLPGLPSEPIPFLPRDQVDRTYGSYSSFDLGRGCPFKCSFCTIINVQGRKSRFRDADDLEQVVRENHAIGVHSFFLTDDNFARNRNWEPCLDRLIKLREEEGIKLRLSIQVDTMCHKINGFIDKCCRAGVSQIFIGMENINPENLLAVKKKQNKIDLYKELILAWKRYPVIICAGYIIGFPSDTHDSLINDVETIKRELAIDFIYFTILTPLPGCEDHKLLVDQGVWMDPDMNKYDLNHWVTKHPVMSTEECDRAYDAVWEHFYGFEHVETVFRRMVALGSNMKLTTLFSLWGFREFKRVYKVHPLEGGLIRIRHRTDRRPGYKIEPAWRFYPVYLYDTIVTLSKIGLSYLRMRRILNRVWTDPKRFEYTDEAITHNKKSFESG